MARADVTRIRRFIQDLDPEEKVIIGVLTVLCDAVDALQNQIDNPNTPLGAGADQEAAVSRVLRRDLKN